MPHRVSQIAPVSISNGQNVAERKPLEYKEFYLILKNLNLDKIDEKIAIAVSGGPDSIALAYLMSLWSKKTGKKVYAFTVNHCLRKDSLIDAKFAGQQCKKLGIPHKILTWNRKFEIISGIQSKARDARYLLLRNACNKIGAKTLITAHHNKDQAETFLLRLSSCSGLDGLAAMKSIHNFKDLNIVRPLLKISKERLILTLSINCIPWLYDAMNIDHQFSRAKIRSLIHRNTYLEKEMIRAAEAFLKLKKFLDRTTSNILKEDLQFYSTGYAIIKRQTLQNIPKILTKRLFTKLIWHIGAKNYPTKSKKIYRLVTIIYSDYALKITLGGCYINIRENEIYISREPARIEKKPLKISPNSSNIWDGRFYIKNQSENKTLLIYPLRDYKSLYNYQDLKKHHKNKLPYAVYLSMPVFFYLDEPTRKPHLHICGSNNWSKKIQVKLLLNQMVDFDVHFA